MKLNLGANDLRPRRFMIMYKVPVAADEDGERNFTV
jgi:hypothetical protein